MMAASGQRTTTTMTNTNNPVVNEIRSYLMSLLKYALTVYFVVWLPIHLMQEYIEHQQTWSKEFDNEVEMNRVCNQASDAVKVRMQEHCEHSQSVVWWGFHLGIAIPKLVWHFVERDILLGMCVRQILSWYNAYGQIVLFCMFGVFVLAVASVFQQMISHLSNQLLVLVGMRNPNSQHHPYGSQSDVPSSSVDKTFYGNPSAWQHPQPTGEGSSSSPQQPPPLLPTAVQFFALPTTTTAADHNNHNYTAIAQNWLAATVAPLPSQQHTAENNDDSKKHQ